MNQTFDLVILGAGMAGLNALTRAVEAGKTVAVVERDRVGGSCPIRGCIPTKALIRSAEVAFEARRAHEFGILVGQVDVDFPAVMSRVRGIIEKGEAATRGWIESLEGVELFHGEGRFVSATEVVVGDRILRAPRIVIATGATPSRPPIPGLSECPYLTSDDVLNMTVLPDRLLIIGAGAIALELGQAISRLGSDVTMVDVLPTLLPDEEPRLVEMLTGYLADEGIEILTGASVVSVRPGGGGGVRIAVERAGRRVELHGDALLVAAGRTPATAALDLSAAGIDGDDRGVKVDSHLRTSRPEVYAAGDVLGAGWGAFTHVARRLGTEVADNALGLIPHDVDPDVGARAIFTDPELVTVGLTEDAARSAGHTVQIGTGTFRGGKARAWGEERGMVKIVAEAGTGRLLGAHVLGYHAADLIHPVTVAMATGTFAAEAIGQAPHVHPTLGEVVKAAVVGAR